MGKQSKLKRLRKLARTMPPETDYVIKVEKMTGKEIIEQDKRETLSNGEKVNPGVIYNKRVKVPVPADHYEKMKKALKKGNVEAVRDYVTGVTLRYEKEMERREAQKEKAKQQKSQDVELPDEPLQ
jgi:citrate lyase synthetase